MKDPKTFRVKLISMGNAETGKVKLFLLYENNNDIDNNDNDANLYSATILCDSRLRFRS